MREPRGADPWARTVLFCARLVGLATFAALWLCAPVLAAQATVQTQISADRVEVGQELTIRIQGESPEGTLDNPRLRVPPSFVVNGPSVGTQKKISIVNGRMESSTGTTATWVLVPTKVGTFEIGPGSFNDSGRTLHGQVARVEVVAEGTLPRRQRPRGRFPLDDDPFAPFGRRGSLFDDLFGEPVAPRMPPAPPEFQVAKAPDATAFLRAVVTPAQAVVGQQVTLRVYAYGARGTFAEGPAKEARHPDFFAYPITGNSLKQNHYTVDVGGHEYVGLKVREIALFPLKAGELHVGPMTMSFFGRAYTTRTAPEGMERSSEALTVSVSEPPGAGRPPGYQLGDVGDFTLEAKVTPAEVDAGGAVSIVAEVKGSGRLPGRLALPEQKGVDWLDPTLADQVRADSNGVVGGSRTFTYLVRLDNPGNVELGELTLPYYSPSKRRYEVLRAPLGTVRVKPGTAEASKDPPRERLSDHLSPRPHLANGVSSSWHLADEPWFYPALVLPATLVVVTRIGVGALVSARRRRAARGKDPRELARQAHLEGQQRIGRGDFALGIPLLERALFLQLEASTGLKGRAVLLGELQAKAEGAGVPTTTAKELVALLGDCQGARFAGAETDARSLLARTSRCLKELGGVRPRNEARN